MIEIKNLNKIYSNGIQAVFDLNLSIKKNDFVVFVGPSGCGKSSTLRTIAGLEEISSGSLVINEKIVNNYSPKDRGISMVFQNYALYPHLSVYKNIRFPLENDKRELYLSYKNNFLIKKEIKKLFYKFNEEKKTSLLQFDSLNSNLINSKFELKELKSIYSSDILKLRSEERNENTKYNAKYKLLKTSKNIKGLRTLEDDFNNYKNLLNQRFQKYKEEHLQNIKIKKQNINEIKKNVKLLTKTFSKQKSSTFKIDEFKEGKKKLILENKIKNPYFAWRRNNHKKVLDATKLLGLSDYIYRKPKDLSGGQRQRVALGRAIVRSPQVFLLDEPLSNLDAKLRASMRETILAIHKKIDVATIYVTHDQIEAMTMATKIVVLKDGFAQQIDPPLTVYDKPSNMFVASFIGSPEINFFEGKLIKDKFISNELSFSLPESILSKISNYNNKKIILGIRPEHFSSQRIVIDTYKDTKLNFCIDSKEIIGKEIIFYGKVNKGNQTRQVVLSTSDIFIKNKNIIELGINKNRLHFFDPLTEESINHDKSKETIKALKIWSEGKEKREINNQLLEKEIFKAANKGIVKKTINLIKKIKEERTKNETR